MLTTHFDQFLSVRRESQANDTHMTFQAKILDNTFPVELGPRSDGGGTGISEEAEEAASAMGRVSPILEAHRSQLPRRKYKGLRKLISIHHERDWGKVFQTKHGVSHSTELLGIIKLKVL